MRPTKQRELAPFLVTRVFKELFDVLEFTLGEE